MHTMRTSLFIALLMWAAVAPASGHRGQSKPFVEPSLLEKRGDVSIIVRAGDVRAAARAVREAGGRVTSELRIVDSVAARIPAWAIERLAQREGIVSIVENKNVRTAADWNGWVSDLRLQKGQYTVTGTLHAPPSHLPDGGFVQVIAEGEVLIVNPDGSERTRTLLTTGGPFYSPAAVDSSGRLFIGAVYGCMYALNPDGTVLWQNATMLNTVYFYPKPVISSDGTVIVVGYNGVVYGFDPDNGNIRWQQTIIGKRAEYITSPIIAPDDTMYVSSKEGDLFAVTSTGGVRWSVSLNGIASASPVLSNGVIYLASGLRVVALDAATGAQRFSFPTDGTLIGSPLIAPDGGILAASATTLYSITTSGALHWKSTLSGKVFTYPPVVSPDDALIYISTATSKGKNIAYVNGFKRTNGAQAWTPFQTADLIVTPPVMDADGGVLFATKNTSVYRVGIDGTESHRLKTHTAITHLSHASDTGNIVIRLGAAPQLIFMGRLANEWNGRKDVEPGSSRMSWKLVNPYSVDIGADQVHKKGIRGGDVGVAVLDSGVYWDPEVKSVLGVQLQHQFIGQADYVQPLCGLSLGCVQNSDHAFLDFTSSRDSHGHGTHVAGTISNKLLFEALAQGQNSDQIFIGVAPDARILSVRVLGADGTGSYESVIKGIQYVIDNQSRFNVRVLNLSISAYATVPYFVDPLNRAVERAWKSGIVVLAAAGNTGPFAQTISVPGNDPYVITVGAVNSRRTAAFWKDDIVANWSATGPTHDGFVKPDVLAPGAQIVSYMYNDPLGMNTPTLVRQHPDYSATASLFRMNGTSMATAVASGVVALMLQANPALTPDQVKYRLMNTARWAVEHGDDPAFNTFQQGMGRIWAPDAVFDSSLETANTGMDLGADLNHGYETVDDLQYHYQGPVQRMLSDSGDAWLFYSLDNGNMIALGVSDLSGHWLDRETALGGRYTWNGATNFLWAGGQSLSGNLSGSVRLVWGGVRLVWGGSGGAGGSVRLVWGGVRLVWGGTIPWGGGSAWGSVRLVWGGSLDAYATAKTNWVASLATLRTGGSNVRWIEDDWAEPPVSDVPPPAGIQP